MGQWLHPFISVVVVVVSTYRLTWHKLKCHVIRDAVVTRGMNHVSHGGHLYR